MRGWCFGGRCGGGVRDGHRRSLCRTGVLAGCGQDGRADLALGRQHSRRGRTLGRLAITERDELLELGLEVDPQSLLFVLDVLPDALPARRQVRLEGRCGTADASDLAGGLYLDVAIVAGVEADGRNDRFVTFVKKRAALVDPALLVMLGSMLAVLI